MVSWSRGLPIPWTSPLLTLNPRWLVQYLILSTEHFLTYCNIHDFSHAPNHEGILRETCLDPHLHWLFGPHVLDPGDRLSSCCVTRNPTWWWSPHPPKVNRHTLCPQARKARSSVLLAGDSILLEPLEPQPQLSCVHGLLPIHFMRTDDWTPCTDPRGQMGLCKGTPERVYASG